MPQDLYGLRRQDSDKLAENQLSHLQPEAGNFQPRRGGRSASPQQFNIIPVRNSSGQDLLSRDIVQLGWYIEHDNADPSTWFVEPQFWDYPAVEAYLPDTDFLNLRPAAVMLTDSPIGEPGFALLFGVIAIKVNFIDRAHRYAIIETGQTYLKSAADGPNEIIWHELVAVPGGTGVKNALVVFGKGTSISRGNVAKDPSGLGVPARDDSDPTNPVAGSREGCHVWKMNDSDVLYDTEVDVTLYNWTSNIVGADDAFIHYDFDDDGIAWVDAEDC